MNLQQLRVIRETVRCNFNLTEAASALFTSQSGVSRHIKELEDEIGVELFVRRGKRLVGLTDPGKELIVIVDRILLDARNIKALGEQFSNSEQGTLTIATTHTQARYVLPPVITEFRKSFPKVQLVLHQASPTEISAMLLSGVADIAIASEALQDVPAFATFPYNVWHHGVIVPAGHPLVERSPLTLEELTSWPIVTYTTGLTGRTKVDEAFAKAGLEAEIIMSALDADVIKAYVELGLGVGILAAMAFDPEKDKGLRMLSGESLFEANLSRIAVRQGTFLRNYAYRFIELCSPKLTEQTTRSVVSAAGAWDIAALENVLADALKPRGTKDRELQ
jgi:LysR family cys regulon transcriptional activator